MMRLLQQLNLEELVFFDIECVPLVEHFAALPPELQEIWQLREGSKAPEGMDLGEWYSERAGLFAEFGQVICISLGFLTRSRNGLGFRVKTIAHPEEDMVLEEFAQILHKHYPSLSRNRLCGHNIKGFDLPFLCRRMLIRGMSLPAQLDIAALKPWEIPHLDTMELWQFGDRRNFASLRLLAAVFGIPSPKSDIDGSAVGRVFWQDNDLERIANYCALDVVTTARVLLKMAGGELLPDEAVAMV